LGPDILLYSTEFLIKEPHTKHVVTMHQDLAYWGLGEIDGILTAWLALSPATPQSGCMDFVKGSHKSPIVPHADSFNELNLLSRGQEIKVDVAEKDKSRDALRTDDPWLGGQYKPRPPDWCRDALFEPACKKTNNALDYGVPMRGPYDTGNYTLCDAPRGLFHPADRLRYEEI
jgi:hypothetical protein